MEKLLFIYNNPLDGSFGGSQRTVQNFEGLKTRFDVIPYELTNKNNKIKTFFQSLFGTINILKLFKNFNERGLAVHVKTHYKITII